MMGKNQKIRPAVINISPHQYLGRKYNHRIAKQIKMMGRTKL
jgi:hypothetical protein